MLENLEFASEEELNLLLKMAIGRAFRMASLGEEDKAIKAARDVKQIKLAIDEIEEAKCPVLSTRTYIEGRTRISDIELRTVW